MSVTERRAKHSAHSGVTVASDTLMPCATAHVVHFGGPLLRNAKDSIRTALTHRGHFRSRSGSSDRILLNCAAGWDLAAAGPGTPRAMGFRSGRPLSFPALYPLPTPPRNNLPGFFPARTAAALPPPLRLLALAPARRVPSPLLASQRPASVSHPTPPRWPATRCLRARPPPAQSVRLRGPRRPHGPTPPRTPHTAVAPASLALRRRCRPRLPETTSPTTTAATGSAPPSLAAGGSPAARTPRRKGWLTRMTSRTNPPAHGRCLAGKHSHATRHLLSSGLPGPDPVQWPSLATGPAMANRA